MKTPHRPQGGFTLLELLVVLVVLGLLAGIVAPKYFNQLGKSETKVARAQIEGLVKAWISTAWRWAATPPPSRA